MSHTKVKTLVFVMILTIMGAASPKKYTKILEIQPDKVIEMKGTDNMQYSKTEITAQPGQTIQVKLTTESQLPKSAMAHNFVLLKQDVNGQAVAQACAKASDNEYIAPEMEKNMIAYTGMAGDGQTVTVTFVVPEATGEYEYICTFPGHYVSGMKGTLIVQ